MMKCVKKVPVNLGIDDLYMRSFTEEVDDLIQSAIDTQVDVYTNMFTLLDQGMCDALIVKKPEDKVFSMITLSAKHPGNYQVTHIYRNRRELIPSMHTTVIGPVVFINVDSIDKDHTNIYCVRF